MIHYHTLLYHTITNSTLPYYSIPYSTISYNTILYTTIPYHTLLYHTTPYSTVLYSTIPYSTISYSTLTYNTILYATIPYHILLYHTLQYHITVPCKVLGRGFFRHAGSFIYISRQGMTSHDLCLQLITSGQENQPWRRQPNLWIVGTRFLLPRHHLREAAGTGARWR